MNENIIKLTKNEILRPYKKEMKLNLLLDKSVDYEMYDMMNIADSFNNEIALIDSEYFERLTEIKEENKELRTKLNLAEDRILRLQETIKEIKGVVNNE